VLLKFPINDLDSSLNKIFTVGKKYLIHKILYIAFIFISLACIFFVIRGLFRAEILLGIPYPIVFFLRWFLIFGTASELWNLLGYSFYRSKFIPLKEIPSDFKPKLVVQFISRGINTEILKQSAKSVLAQKDIFSQIELEIRIVTEKPVSNCFIETERSNYNFIEVPQDFQCPNGSMYKARGLEYARLNCDLEESEDHPKWILFMDEESLLTESSARGVLNFLIEDRKQNLIGEGMITYTGGTFGKPFLIAAVDCNRVGWDIGRLYCQFAIFNDLYFAFHGSFFVTSTKLINQIGFDFGKEESVTEDICFAGIAAKQGFRFRWIEGFVREQSPETYLDFLKQRRRWIKGSTFFIFSPRFPLRSRLSVALNNIILRFAPLATFIVLASVDFYSINYNTVIIAYLCALRPSQLMGILYTLQDSGIDSSFKKTFVGIIFILISPAVILLETLASIYAVVTVEKGFHVIQKTSKIDSVPLSEISL
jgi:cellulose synthase/poly-beta-1,6-N-acetylglucosamine synthase-like glycosyltransferase